MFQTMYNSYLFRLVVIAVPYGVIAYISLWISNLAELHFLITFAILVTLITLYTFSVDEKYVKSWRQEQMNTV